MSPSFIILIITGLLVYNVYYDNILVKSFSSYYKYYKIAGIIVLGIGFYSIIKKNPKESIETINALNQYINVMPIDKSSKNMITPFLTNTQNNASNKSTNRLMQNSRTHKRSVSETKKKVCSI